MDRYGLTVNKTSGPLTIAWCYDSTIPKDSIQ